MSIVPSQMLPFYFRLVSHHGVLNAAIKVFLVFILMLKKDCVLLIMLPDVDWKWRQQITKAHMVFKVVQIG